MQWNEIVKLREFLNDLNLKVDLIEKSGAKKDQFNNIYPNISDKCLLNMLENKSYMKSILNI